MTEFVCMIHQGCIRWPEATAVVCGSQALTYRALDAQVNIAAQALSHCDPCVTVKRSVTGTLDDVVQLLAAQRIGLCVMPLNPQLPDDWLNAAVKNLVLADWPEPTQNAELTAKTGKTAKTAITPIAANCPLHWILTSGSTGTPKVAVLSMGNHHYSAIGSLWYLHSQVGDRYWMSLPLFHVGGLSQLFRCFLSGATLVIPNQRLSADCLAEFNITHLSLVPTQLQRLLAERQDALSHCKSILLGGAPAPQHLLDQAKHLPLQTTYGLTEMASQVVTKQPDGHYQLLPYRALKISTLDEILVKGDTLFLGYQTAAGLNPSVDADGWFRTRDTGSWNGQRLVITGRIDNQFISGGENIQPEVLERIALGYATIEQAVVVPVSDTEFGQRPVIYVSGATDLNGFLTWFISHIPKHANPIAVLPLPPQAGLKINRQGLQQLAEQHIHGNLA